MNRGGAATGDRAPPPAVWTAAVGGNTAAGPSGRRTWGGRPGRPDAAGRAGVGRMRGACSGKAADFSGANARQSIRVWIGGGAVSLRRCRSRIEARNLGCRLQVRPVCCRDAASGGLFVALERPPREGTRRPASHRIGVLGVADPPYRLRACRRESARGGVFEILPEAAWDSLRLETGSTLGNAIGSGLPRATRSPSGT